MSESIFNASELNMSNIKFAAPKANASGGKSIAMFNKISNTILKLKLPLFKTWGASDFVDESGKGNGKFELSLQFPDEDEQTEETRETLKKLIMLEAKIKEMALTNSMVWFGKQHKSSEVVDALWTPMLKYSKNKNTGEPDLNKAPCLRIKLAQWEGEWKFSVFDGQYTKIFPDPTSPEMSPLDLFRKGSKVATMIQCGGLWFANGKFGITWKLSQAVVQKQKQIDTNQCMIQLSVTERAVLTNGLALENDEAEEVQEQKVSTTQVEDSDSEEEEELEPAQVSVPEPVPRVATPPPVVQEVISAVPIKKKVAIKKKDTVTA